MNKKDSTMDWFEQLFGFAETSTETVHKNMSIDADELVSKPNGRRFFHGQLTTPALKELRQACEAAGLEDGTEECRASRLQMISGDVRALHSQPAQAGGVFQVASQFNVLEMVSPNVSPEEGITRYAGDPTQGPACALAAAAGTVFRNYFVPLNDGPRSRQGQTRAHQIDTSARLRRSLAKRQGVTEESLWVTRNGYALPTEDSLTKLAALITAMGLEERKEIMGELQVGVHAGVEVTDPPHSALPLSTSRQRVTQVYCSAMPVAYGVSRKAPWGPLARLVLDAAYEATFRAAALHVKAGGSNLLLLTRLGGGAFGNEATWIDAAIERACRISGTWDLDVRLVTRGPVSSADLALCARVAA